MIEAIKNYCAICSRIFTILCVTALLGWFTYLVAPHVTFRVVISNESAEQAQLHDGEDQALNLSQIMPPVPQRKPKVH